MKARSSTLRARLRRVKLLLCDVDGILTDGTVFISGDGRETKRFSIHDGLGIVLARKHGLRVGWVSARPSPATSRRAKELHMDILHQDKGPKLNAVEAILVKAGVGWDELCFMGDDVVDLAVLRRAGFAVSVPGGVAEALAFAHYVTRARGGHGAVREVVEMILKAQGKWTSIVREYAQ